MPLAPSLTPASTPMRGLRPVPADAAPPSRPDLWLTPTKVLVVTIPNPHPSTHWLPVTITVADYDASGRLIKRAPAVRATVEYHPEPPDDPGGTGHVMGVEAVYWELVRLDAGLVRSGWRPTPTPGALRESPLSPTEPRSSAPLPQRRALKHQLTELRVFGPSVFRALEGAYPYRYLPQVEEFSLWAAAGLRVPRVLPLTKAKRFGRF